MDELIEKILQKRPLVDYATIKSLLTESGYKYINDKIKYMKQKGLLISLKKGLYLYNSPYYPHPNQYKNPDLSASS